jgi:hypothetical protein
MMGPLVTRVQTAPNPELIKTFIRVLFDYSEGWVAVRQFPEKGNPSEAPRTPFFPADSALAEYIVGEAKRAAGNGLALYVVPGTVSAPGKAKADDVIAMQTVLVDLDHGDVGSKRDHLAEHLGAPSLEVVSGGTTEQGQERLHLYWKLTESAVGTVVAAVCKLRSLIAAKVGGDPSFGSAHQPIRVAGSIYRKGGVERLVAIRDARSLEYELSEFAEKVAAMPALPGVGADPSAKAEKPTIDDVLKRPVREGGEDAWTRFQGASAAIGHYIRLVHDGRISSAEGWEAICQFNAAMLRPPWPLDRLKAEADRLWRVHVERHGPALQRQPEPPVAKIPAYRFGALLDDLSPMPPDIIAPRLLTPGGMLVLGGAPKVGKSDFLISLLVHMAAGEPFLGFAPPRALRVFYLQAEIQYHYLRERLQGMALPPAVLEAARENLVVTPKLRVLLDERGVALASAAITEHFPDASPDILCIDPIRNLFDGGPDSGGENDNSAMLFFLQARVEALRDAIAPDAGLILCHHTRKTQKKQLAEDPFMALSGASALRGFYTSGIVMHRPDEERSERRLEFELRNGPAIQPLTIDKRKGRWIVIDCQSERLVRKDFGEKLDAERGRKNDVILQVLCDEARLGRLYTALQFAESFENKAGLGGCTTIRERISVLATKGFVKFARDGAPFGLPNARSKFGYLCVEGMEFLGNTETIDPDTGEVAQQVISVLPSHYKSPLTGAVLEVENPYVWVYPEGETP